MIKNKTIMIAHGWSDVSLNFQSKALALALSVNNRVFFLNTKKTGKETVVINNSLIIYEWPGKRPVGWKDLLFAIKKMKRDRPDIIITNFAANDIMLFVAWMFNVKYRVCYFHTMVEQHIADHKSINLRQRINIFRKGFVFRMATHMLPSTRAAKKDLVKYYKVQPEKAFIFPNALPDTAYRNTGANDSIGFLGRLDRSKGVDILIRAFKKVSEQYNTASLIIVGKGAMEEELRKMVQELALSNKVHFRGAISYSEVPNFLASINFLVVPSRTDNLPTVALEALSVATPVIGSNAGGIPDIIEEGYNGFLFESCDTDDLALKMINLITDKEKRDRLSVNARRSFETKYCVENLLARFEKLIQKED